MSTVTNSIERTVAKKLSERWSVIDFGAVGDGVTNDAPAINDAIAAAADDGGHEIYLPGGRTYLLEERVFIDSGMENVVLVGDGDATLLKRGASITVGQGLIDIHGASVTMRNFKVDGDVTTSVGLVYGTPGDFANDPQNNALSQNSSFWVHGGARRIRFDGVTVVHTGGYAILFDARNADILDVRVEFSLFENCRPHLFGTSSGDKNYGAWTGGILFQGDCRSSESKLFSVRGAQLRGNRFHRMNGNCIWMHSYGFDTQHENIVVSANEFAYIARDAYLAGNLRGGSCTGNTARFVGFRHTTDSDTPVGAYLANHYAVGFDASGYVSDHPMTGNTVVEFYGGGFDLDGLRDSVVSNNTISSSQAIAKGMQTGDTSANGGGKNLVIAGNRFAGCNAGSLVLNQAEGCLVEGNMIDHPAGASVIPVLLYSTNKQTKDNTVRNNDIYYPADNWCIAEDDGGTGTGFDSTTSNIVYGNRYRGARGEFLKIASSASVTGVVFSTNSASATTRQETTLQREGTGSSAAWKIYDKQGATQKQYVQLQYANGLFNISEDGASQTGILTTAARTTLGFKDAVWTGKLMADGFLAMYDYAGASTSYQAADANALDANWALIRYNKAATKWEQSLSVSAGARVWADFTGGGGVAGLTAGRIPYAASSTALADSANLAWNNTSQVLTVTGATGTAGIVVASAFVQAAEGFYTTSTATDAIQAPSGGVTARFLIGTRSLTLVAESAANAGLSGSGQGRIYFDSGVNKFRVSENGGAYVDLLGSGGSVAGLTAGRVPYASTATTLADSANLAWNNTSQVLTVTGATGTAGLVVASAFVQAGEGFYTTSTATSAVNVPSGGVTARFLIGTRSFTLAADTAANAGLSSSGQGRLYFDSTSNKFRVSENGGAYTDLVVNGVTSITGTANQVIASAATGAVTLSLPQSIHTGATVQFAGANLSTATVGDFATLTGNRTNSFGFSYGGAVIGGASASTFYALSIGGGNRSAGLTLGVLSFHGFGPNATLISSVSARIDAICDTSTSTDYGAHLDFSTTKSASVSGTASGVRMRITSYGNILIATTTDDTTGAKLQIAGFVSATTGYYSASTSYQAVQAPSGGVYARSGHFLQYIHIAGGSGVPTATSGASVPANGMIYYDTGLGKFRAYEGSSWKDMIPVVASVAGSNTQIQFNSSGAFGADSNLVWDNTNKRLGIGATPSEVLHVGAGVVRLGGRLQVTASVTPATRGGVEIGYDAAANGAAGWGSIEIYVPGSTTARPVALIAQDVRLYAGTVPSERMRVSSGGAVWINQTSDDSSGAILQLTGFVSATSGYYTSSTATDAFKALSGGVTARFLIATRSMTVTSDTAANAGLSSAGQGRIYFDSTSNKFRISENGGAYVDLIGGTGVTSITGTANQVNASASTGAVTLSLPQSINTSATVRFGSLGLGAAPSVPLHVFGNVSNEIARFQPRGDSNNSRSYISLYTTNPAYWWEISNQDPSGGGTTNSLAFMERSASGSAIARVYFAVGGNVMFGTMTDDSSGAKVQVSGFVSATSGYYTSSTATDAFKALTGGVTARFLIATRSMTVTADTAANAGVSSSGQGRIYFDSSVNKFRVSENGGAYVDLLSTAGVTSITGTANQVNASASTGAVTLSLPQSIHTGATVQFSGANLSTATVGDFATLTGSRLNPTGFSYGGIVIGGAQANTFYSVAIGGGNRSSGVPIGILSFHGFGPNTSMVSSISARIDAICDTSTSTDYGAHLDFYTTKSASVSGTASGVRMRITSYGNILIATTTDDSSGAKVQVSGFISATSGYYTSSTATDAFKALTGGVTARFLIATRSMTLTADTAANAGVSSSGQGRIYFDSTSNKFRISENGGAYVDLVGSGGVASITGTANQVNASASTGSVTLSLPQSIHTGATVQFASVGIGAAPAVPLHIFGNVSNEIARFQPRGDSNNSRSYISLYTTNPAYWWEISNQDTSGNGTLNGIAFLERSGSGSPIPRVYFCHGGNILFGTLFDDSTGAKVQVSGFVSATSGYYSSSSSYQAVQAPSGGVYTRSGHFLQYIHIAGGSGVPTATSGASVPANGMIYYDTGLGKFRAYENGSWKDLISGGGVTSLTGTTNQVNVSASTGAVTLSLPQSINTGASVQFYSLLTSDAIQSNRSTGPAIYAPNAYMQAKGFVSSGLSAYNSIQTDAGFSCGTGTGGGYHVASTQVISTAGQFVGLGVNCPSYGIAASGFNPNYFGTQYYGQNLGAVSVRRGDDTGSGTLTIYGGVVVAVSGL